MQISAIKEYLVQTANSIWSLASDKESLKNIINAVAISVFAAFTFTNGGPYFWTVSFFVGAFAANFVKVNISDVFSEMSKMWVIPTTLILYSISWPATLTMQAILSGLDMGYRCSYAARGLLSKNGERTFLCFRV